eukprot:PhF_6_TR44507/c0_g1_i1/m.68549
MAEHVAVYIDIDPSMEQSFDTSLSHSSTKISTALRGFHFIRHVKSLVTKSSHTMSLSVLGKQCMFVYPPTPVMKLPQPPTSVKLSTAPCGAVNFSSVLLDAYQSLITPNMTNQLRLVLIHGRCQGPPPTLTPEVEEMLRSAKLQIDSVFLYTANELAEVSTLPEHYDVFRRVAELTRGYALRACSDDATAMRYFGILSGNGMTRPPQDYYATAPWAGTRLTATAVSEDGSTMGPSEPVPTLRLGPIVYHAPITAEVLEMVSSPVLSAGTSSVKGGSVKGTPVPSRPSTPPAPQVHRDPLDEMFDLPRAHTTTEVNVLPVNTVEGSQEVEREGNIPPRPPPPPLPPSQSQLPLPHIP